MIRLFLFFLRLQDRTAQLKWFYTCMFAVIVGFVELMAIGAVAFYITSLTSLDDVLSSSYFAPFKVLFSNDLLADPKRIYLVVGAGAVGLMILKNVLASIFLYTTGNLARAMGHDVGLKMFKGFMYAPYAWSARQNPAEVHSCIWSRIYVSFFPGLVMVIFSETIVSLFLVASMFYFEPMVTTIVFSIVLLAGGGGMYLFKNKIGHYAFKAQELRFVNDKICQMGIHGLRDMVVFNARTKMINVFSRQDDRYGYLRAWGVTYEKAPTWCLELVGFCGIVVGSLWMLYNSEYTTARIMGTLSLLAVSAWRMLPSMNRIIGAIGSIRGNEPYMRKVKGFIEQLHEVNGGEEYKQHASLPSFSDELVIKDLSLSYDGGETFALSDLNFSVTKGSCVGIIGHSGAGKSTLIDVLTGFLAPTKGGVWLDDTPITEECRDAWREQLGVIPQKPYLYDGTVAENVSFAMINNELDFERLKLSCRLAGAEDFILNLPNAYDSSIGDGGALLSGGQQQRIAIARALYKDPEVLIFDEATSSLDSQNEKKIQQTISNLQGTKTMILIAHRLSSVEQCDSIVWLERGKIIKIGPPEVILPEYRKHKS